MRWDKSKWLKILSFLLGGLLAIYFVFDLIWQIITKNNKKKTEEKIQKIREQTKDIEASKKEAEAIEKFNKVVESNFDKTYREVKNNEPKKKVISFDDAVNIIDDTIKRNSTDKD